MILFDYDKAVHLMERQGIDILLPHTLMNAGYLADHWVHDQHTSFHPYMALDMNEVYLLMVGLPERKTWNDRSGHRELVRVGTLQGWHTPRMDAYLAWDPGDRNRMSRCR